MSTAHIRSFPAPIDPRLHNIGNAKANSEALKSLFNRVAKLKANVNKINTNLTGISRELVQGIQTTKELISNEIAEPEGFQVKDALIGLGSALKEQLNSLDVDMEEALMKIEELENGQKRRRRRCQAKVQMTTTIPKAPANVQTRNGVPQIPPTASSPSAKSA